MTSGRPLEDQVVAAIIADIEARQLGRNAIARKHEVGLGVVSRIARDAGIHDAFDRSRTARATADRQADLKARRIEEAENCLDDASRLRDRFFDPYEITVSTPVGAQTLVLDVPPAAELRNFVTAYAVLIDKHVALTRHDSVDTHDDAKSMLIGIAEGLEAFQRARDQQSAEPAE